MKKKKAKLEMETLGKILLLTAFMIIFLIMFKGCKDSFEDVGIVGMKEYFCWGSNLLNAKGSSFFPTTCSPTIIGEDLDKKEISDLIRRCWWMYGKGELDIKSEGLTDVGIKDQVYTCYAFKPKEDISLTSLKEHMQEHTIGDKKAEKYEDSTWYYVQKGTKEEYAICFEEKKFAESNGMLLAGKTYYINFYDERVFGGEGDQDRIMIGKNSKFGEELTRWEDFWWLWMFDHCYDIGQGFVEKQKKICEGYNKTECFSHLEQCVPYAASRSGEDYGICKPCNEVSDDSKMKPLIKSCPDINLKELCNIFNQGGQLCGIYLKCRWEGPKGLGYQRLGCISI